jgi:hypothetical protein
MSSTKRPQLFSSARSDWNTPDEVLGLVRQHASPEGIALDPCSNPTSFVNAEVEWRLERGEDGLALPWEGQGLTFVNPPYGPGLMRNWAEKICEEAAAGVEIIALVPARTETRWFALFWHAASAICFWAGRIRFVQPEEPGSAAIASTANAATFPSAVVYLGSRVERFHQTFSVAGKVVVLKPAEVSPQCEAVGESPEKALLTCEEVRHLLGYRSTAAVRMLVRRGQLVPYGRRGTTHVFRLEEVHAFLRSTRRSSLEQALCDPGEEPDGKRPGHQEAARRAAGDTSTIHRSTNQEKKGGETRIRQNGHQTGPQDAKADVGRVGARSGRAGRKVDPYGLREALAEIEEGGR